MYTRNYASTNEDGLVIPEQYSGVAFSDSGQEKECLHNEECERESPTKSGGETESVFSSLTRFLPTKLFGNGKLSLLKNGFSSFDTEDILLLVIAAFLFFSKDGDRECAIMLILILFMD